MVMETEKAQVVNAAFASVFTFGRSSGVPGPREQWEGLD